MESRINYSTDVRNNEMFHKFDIGTKSNKGYCRQFQTTSTKKAQSLSNFIIQIIYWYLDIFYHKIKSIEIGQLKVATLRT